MCWARCRRRWCAQGADTRLLLPGLPGIIDAVLHARRVCQIGPVFGAARVNLLRAQMPYSRLPVYVIDAPFLYRRGGSPYQDSQGSEWPDNLQRFGLLGWVAAQMAQGELDAEWVPDVLHAHDWHAAMSCAYLHAHPAGTAASVFTIHNLAFQGLFPHDDCAVLGLSSRYMSPSALEFHGQLSFMKAGLKFADRVTTVSPTYAREIATPEFGAGLEGVIRGRGADVSGILNGIDTAVWDPAADTALPQRYSAQQLQGKAVCKAALQAHFGLAAEPDAPLLGVVSRLTSQKGLDLVLSVLPDVVRLGGQLVVQGTGEPALEAAFRMAASAHPGRVGVLRGLRRDRRAPAHRRCRHDPGAVALRALRPDADVRPALRHRAGGAARGRPGRHGGGRRLGGIACRRGHRLCLRRGASVCAAGRHFACLRQFQATQGLGSADAARHGAKPVVGRPGT